MNGRRRVRPLIHWVAAADPLVPAAEQRADVLHATLLEHERRPGARRFVPSSTVGHDRLLGFEEDLDDPFIFWRPGEPTLQRQLQGTRDVTELEGVGNARVDDGDVFRSDELFELCLRDAGRIDLRGQTERGGQQRCDGQKPKAIHVSNIACR